MSDNGEVTVILVEAAEFQKTTESGTEVVYYDEGTRFVGNWGDGLPRLTPLTVAYYRYSSSPPEVDKIYWESGRNFTYSRIVLA